MTTHGTRSAYNRGCRCDECREAARLARARQRASQSSPTRSPPVAVNEGPTAQDVLVIAGALIGGTGVWTLWRGWKKLRSDEEHSGR